MWIGWLMERRSLIWRVAYMILNASNCGERLKLDVKVRGTMSDTLRPHPGLERLRAASP